MKLQMRLSNPADYDELKQLCFEAILDSPYGHLSHDEYDPTALKAMMFSPDHDVLIAEVGGEIVGMACFFVMQLPFSKTIRQAQEVFWYVKRINPKDRARTWLEMLKFYNEWAVNKGVRFACLESMDPVVDKMYEANGFYKISTVFRKEY